MTIFLTCVAAVVLASPAGIPADTTMRSMSAWEASASLRILGPTRSGLPWHSGAWLAEFDGSTAEGWGRWRGSPSDLVTTYPEMKRGWEGIKGSRWHIASFTGFGGRLLYGLPLGPEGTEDPLREVADGKHDDVWAQVADDLVAEGRGNAIVRVGWEANGDWMSWSATADSAPLYRAAFRRVATILKSRAPDLRIDFDISCATRLRGQDDRLDSLRRLYPGDDVVDIIGCDTYDWWDVKVTDEAGWRRHLRPADSVGLADVADFARQRGKGMSVPEWGVAGSDVSGSGDNPLFVTKMREFFESNQDVLTVEAYFDDVGDHVKSSLIRGQNPRAANTYRSLWSRPAGPPPVPQPGSTNSAEGPDDPGGRGTPQVAGQPAAGLDQGG